MYSIVIKKKAKKFDKLTKKEKERILDAIKRLPNGEDIKPLKGNQNKELLPLRIGKYRIIYTI